MQMKVKSKRILGIDYGDFSIGLAIFDLETDFIYPYKTIFRERANVLRKSIREISSIMKEESISDVVIGLPLNADGTEGERVEKVKHFANMLKNVLEMDVTISFQDERLTTVEAKSILAEKGVKKEDWKKTIDQIAAEIILQDFRQQNRR